VHCNTPSTLAHLQFRTKFKSTGRPKRLERQLSSFNRTSADAALERRTRGRKRKPKVGNLTTTFSFYFCVQCFNRPYFSRESGFFFHANKWYPLIFLLFPNESIQKLYEYDAIIVLINFEIYINIKFHSFFNLILVTMTTVEDSSSGLTHLPTHI